MSRLTPGGHYRILGILGNGQALVGHTVELISEVDFGAGQYRLVRVRSEDQQTWQILARLRRADPDPCQCERLPFPHRRTIKCHDAQQ